MDGLVVVGERVRWRDDRSSSGFTPWQYGEDLSNCMTPYRERLYAFVRQDERLAVAA